jgi:putative ABC transport system ATP-binding protein
MERVSKAFDLRNHSAVIAIDDVTAHIPEQSATLITGPSGSGKTTLLSIMGCMMRPTAGRVVVSGRDVTRLDEDLLAEARRHHFGFVFQARYLIRRATALENVMVPGIPGGEDTRSLRRRARSLLAEFGVASKADCRVDHLSGGEQQRVALARALINDPEVIIADEPTTHLDNRSADSVIGLLRDLMSLGKTVIVASHDDAIRGSDCFTHRLALEGGRLA